jgi:hypothetical protein
MQEGAANPIAVLASLLRTSTSERRSSATLARLSTAQKNVLVMLHAREYQHDSDLVHR